MIPYVPNAFFARRERIAKLMGWPVELTGIYHSLQPSIEYAFSIARMLKPHPRWEAKIYDTLGYTSNVPSEAASRLLKVKEYFNLMSNAAYFYIGRLPGCCGSAHVHDIFSRNYGMGSICLELAEEGAYYAGYRLITGTVIDSRAFHMVDRYGWTKHRPWVNNRTKNTVYLCSKELTAENAGRRISDGAGKNSNEGSGIKVATVAGAAGFSAQRPSGI